jgi:GNAT superfamily N-acetyltransferase
MTDWTMRWLMQLQIQHGSGDPDGGLRLAEARDAEAVATLVNMAYRPQVGHAGWTHEGHLVAGTRTTAKQVADLLGPGSDVLLLHVGQQLVACVHVQGDETHATIGMLAIDPSRQLGGLGKLMLAHAESHAFDVFHAAKIHLWVLASRPELLAFYERRGYQLTGDTTPYPEDADFGHPRVAGLTLLCLSKPNKSFGSSMGATSASG